MNEAQLPDAAQPVPPTQPAKPAQPAEVSQPIDSGRPEKPRPRTGPIVWGCILIAICAFVLQNEFDPQAVNPSVWIAATAIGLGVLLLVVGLTVVVRGRAGRTSSAGTR